MLSEKQINKLSSRLIKFYGDPGARNAVETYLRTHQDESVSQVFLALTHGQSKGRKSHCSGFDDGAMIENRRINRRCFRTH